MSIEREKQKIARHIQLIEYSTEQIVGHLAYLRGHGEIPESYLKGIAKRSITAVDGLLKFMNLIKDGQQSGEEKGTKESISDDPTSEDDQSTSEESGAHSRASKTGRAKDRERR